VRASGELDVQARNWFERSVEWIERLDGVVVKWHERNLIAQVTVGGPIADSAPTPEPGAAGPIDRAVHRGS